MQNKMVGLYLFSKQSIVRKSEFVIPGPSFGNFFFELNQKRLFLLVITKNIVIATPGVNCSATREPIVIILYEFYYYARSHTEYNMYSQEYFFYPHFFWPSI